MQLFTEVTSDLSSGMWDSVSPARFPQGAVAELYNARIQPDGTAQRRQGTIRTHPTTLGAAPGYGGIAYRTAGGDGFFVAFIGATAPASDDFGATWSQLAASLRQDYYSVAIMRVGATNYLYAANGDTTV